MTMTMTMTRLSWILASRSLESRSQIALRALFTEKGIAAAFPVVLNRALSLSKGRTSAMGKPK